MELWTLKETARNTRMSEAYWRKQVLQRRIPVIKIGRAVRFDVEEVRRFLAGGMRPAVDPILAAERRVVRDEVHTH